MLGGVNQDIYKEGEALQMKAGKVKPLQESMCNKYLPYISYFKVVPESIRDNHIYIGVEWSILKY